MIQADTKNALENITSELTISTLYNIKNYVNYVQDICYFLSYVNISSTSPIESLNTRFSFNRSNQISGMLYKTAAMYIGSIILKHNSNSKYHNFNYKKIN